MIDPKLLRQAATDVAEKLARRGFKFDAAAYQLLEDRRKELQVATEQLQSERNASAKNIGKAKAQGEDIAPLLEAVKDLIAWETPQRNWTLSRPNYRTLSWACRICSWTTCRMALTKALMLS